MKKFLLFLMVAVCYIGAFTVDQDVVNALSKSFSVGEYLRIPITFTDLKDEYLSCRDSNEAERFSLQYSIDGDDNLEISIVQCVRDAGNVNLWNSQQTFWLDIVAKYPFQHAKVYSGSFVVYDAKNRTYSQNVRFSFDVKPPPNNDLSILFSDQTANFDRQIDLEMRLSNPTDGAKSIYNGYFDYYLTSSKKHIPAFDVWSRDENTCFVLYKCGDDKFKLRGVMEGVRSVKSLEDSLIALIGYREYLVNGGDRNYNNYILGDKLSNDTTDKYLDYSYTFPANSVVNQAYIRTRHFNNHIPLYAINRGKLWGEAPSPSDGFDNCRIATLNVDYTYRNSSINEFPCRNELLKEIEAGHTEISSSSSSFSSSSEPYVIKNSDVVIRSYGSVSYTDKHINLHLQTLNKGEVGVDLSKYEIRFYVKGSDGFDASKVMFLIDFNGNYPFIPHIYYGNNMVKCSENSNVYYSGFSFSEGAYVEPNGYVPSYTLDARVTSYETPFYEENFLSWLPSSSFTENYKMALFDKTGKRVYGTDYCKEEPAEDEVKKKLELEVKVMSKYEKKGDFNNAFGVFGMDITNKGDSVPVFPVTADFFIRHKSGKVPLLMKDGKVILNSAGKKVNFDKDVSVIRASVGDVHVFHFTFNKNFKKVEFKLKDKCFDDCEDSQKSLYTWNLDDDWSVKESDQKGNYSVTQRVVLKDADNNILYGSGDNGNSINIVEDGDGNYVLKHNRITVEDILYNRTYGVLYSNGQLLSGGDFEDESIAGWSVAGDVSSERGAAPQGARYITMLQSASVYQSLPSAAYSLLADSGATLMVWHKGDYLDVIINGVKKRLMPSKYWIVDTLHYDASLFNRSTLVKLSNAGSSMCFVDNVVLSPGKVSQPINYASRFTNTYGREAETRLYDGESLQVVSSTIYDAFGRLSKKYLPFAIKCDGAEECNSDMTTLNNPAMAADYYTASNSDYPDAQKYPYTESVWKPELDLNIDFLGLPGKAFSVESKHYAQTFYSGIDLSGVNLRSLQSVNNAARGVRFNRSYDNKYYWSAFRYNTGNGLDLAYSWIANKDQDGRMSFSVVNAFDQVILSGVMEMNNDSSEARIVGYSLNEYDRFGNVTKVHPPMSCEYDDYRNRDDCVKPSEYKYDAKGNKIWSWEPDAHESRNYFDGAGRLVASQTQSQIDSKKVSIVAYDHLGRVSYSGAWKTSLDENQLRSFFKTMNVPSVADLVPGTVTRTLYDKMPSCDTLSVDLYPSTLPAEDFRYTRGRVAAVISDVAVVYDNQGVVAKNSEGEDSVLRVSNAYSYDKYGRILANYTYDASMDIDSLKMMAVKNTYDVGGKLLSSIKSPYGVSAGNRLLREYYHYDNQGRISSIYSDNGLSAGAPVVSYKYYPTGSVQKIVLGNQIELNYTYHISGAIKTADAKRLSDGLTLYSETLFYEDCGSAGCTPQYNGNISRMAHKIAVNGGKERLSDYTYDLMNRLITVDDLNETFDEAFAYDMQGRITMQRRGSNFRNGWGGDYTYYKNSNKLEKVNQNIGDFATSKRNMNVNGNFVYDSEGNLIEDKSKSLKISYDWRGMPVEFVHDVSDAKDAYKLLMAYDGSGRRVSKTRMVKDDQRGYWYTDYVTHYTGIGTEVRESIRRAASPEVKVVVNLPQGLGRYGVEDAADPFKGIDKEKLAGYIPSTKFEWYLKNHLGSTMLVYGTSAYDDSYFSKYQGGVQAAYDYRTFGEQVDLEQKGDKVTENFTGKERDDETELNYFGARYLDPMLGLWTSVDPKRQFSSPYLYAGNGMNPVNGVDPDGNVLLMDENTSKNYMDWLNSSTPEVNAIRWERFNTLNNSPRVYQSIYEERSDFDFTTSGAYAVNGVYDNKTNVGYVNGTMENFFHEILGHAYQDEMFMQQEGRDLDKGVFKNEYIELEVDARQIERGRLLNPEERSDVRDVYGKEWDYAE